MSEPDFLKFDFVHVFPHKAWISNWSSDSQYPAGFQYKLLSSRREPENVIVFLVILQHRSGDKEVLHHSEIQSAAFDRLASIFVKGLADQHKINFVEQDFSACRDFNSFDAAASGFGWNSATTWDAN